MPLTMKRLLCLMTAFAGLTTACAREQPMRIECELSMSKTLTSGQAYLVLNPGERKRATIDRAEGWNVDTPGKYTVEYSAELFDVISGTASAPRNLDDFQPVPVSCGSVEFMRLR
jgi:hypothetical protein